MNEQDHTNHVQGERENAVGGVLSVQSRVSNVLAFGLMSVLGLGSLTWYYANAMLRQGRAKESARAASSQRAQGDMPLPSLGRIDPPAASGVFETVSAQDAPQDRAPLAAPMVTESPLQERPIGAIGGAPAPKTPAQLALERQMSGTVFASRGATPLPGAAPSDALGGGSVESEAAGPNPAGDGGELGTLLRARVTSAVRARILPTQRLLLPKGAFIDCTLETALDSTLPGMTTCVTPTDVFGADGTVVLLERGTKLVGETRGQVQQGTPRIFVLWTEARSPSGVIVPLDSPGADELGRSGLPGEVSRHFWQRFGAAMLVSVIDGAVQAASESSRSGSGSGAVVVNPSESQGVLTEILKNTVNIAPTVLKRNGDRIQVLVARDLDFRSVYELRSAPGR
ncbi:MAG: type IV secretion system protein VirB10 [Pseudomonadota bacterium]|nr:type IV secretion system protein VirB10 [Pseudomonadota bacterium]